MSLFYFGTDLKQHGHYFFELEGEHFPRPFNCKMSYTDLPFDPYDGQRPVPKGTAVFKCTDGYSAFIVSGSCTDDRNGTVSTFVVKETITQEELKKRILDNTLAKQIIDKMNFEIKW